MGILRGLQGVKKDLPATHARSVTDTLRLIRSHRAVTAARSNGALNVWRDDSGQLRSEFMRYMVSYSREEHASYASLRAWLKVWWPQMGAL